VRGILQLTVIVCLLLVNVSGVEGQTAAPEGSPTLPPKLALLVYQKFQFGKASERQRLEVAISHACDRLMVPNSWIDLESLTGPPEALFFDLFDSF